jgi:hypothetical protein
MPKTIQCRCGVTIPDDFNCCPACGLKTEHFEKPPDRSRSNTIPIAIFFVLAMLAAFWLLRQTDDLVKHNQVGGDFKPIRVHIVK